MHKYLLGLALALSAGFAVAAKEPPKLFVRGGQVVRLAPGAYDFGSVSETANAKVVLSVGATNALGAGFTVFKLSVVNKGDKLIGLSPDMVQVTGPKGEAIPVLSYTEIDKLVEKSFGGQKFRAGLGNFVMAMSAASAGYNTNYGTYRSTTRTPYGAYTTTGTVSATTYNPAQAAAAQANARDYIANNNAALQGRMAEKEEQSKQFAFAPETVFPAKAAYTPVPVVLPKGAKAATVVVTIANEPYRFEVALTEDPKASADQVASAEITEWPIGPTWAAPRPDNAGVNAWASEHIDQKGWALAGFDGEGVYFADLSTLEKLPTGAMRMWFKTERFQPSMAVGLPIRSDRSLWELNCAEKKIRTTSIEAHPLNNLQGVSIREENAAAAWSAPPPGSVAETFSTKLCASQAGVAG